MSSAAPVPVAAADGKPETSTPSPSPLGNTSIAPVEIFIPSPASSSTAVRKPLTSSPLTREFNTLGLSSLSSSPLASADVRSPLSEGVIRLREVPLTVRGGRAGEYAQAVMQSRSAKMAKWQMAVGKRENEEELEKEKEKEMSGVRWVDWLDEYKRLKLAVSNPAEASTSASSSSSVILPHSQAQFHSQSQTVERTQENLSELNEFEILENSALHPHEIAFKQQQQPQQSDSPHPQPHILPPQIQPLQRPIPSPVSIPKKKRLGSKIDAWWSTVKNNFTPPHHLSNEHSANSPVTATASSIGLGLEPAAYIQHSPNAIASTSISTSASRTDSGENQETVTARPRKSFTHLNLSLQAGSPELTAGVLLRPQARSRSSSAATPDFAPSTPIQTHHNLSLNTVRKHIAHQLESQKTAADRELSKIISAITDHFDSLESIVEMDSELEEVRPRSPVSSSPAKRKPSPLRRRVSRNIAPASWKHSPSASSSRSQSPMPDRTPSPLWSSPGSSAKRVLSPELPYLPTLQNVAAIAGEIIETRIGALTSRPEMCAEFIGRIQHMGKAWDNHPEWPGRQWWVQLLLQSAALSRVVEWWTAERGFWRFETDEVRNEEETLHFEIWPPPDQSLTLRRPSLASIPSGSSTSAQIQFNKDYESPLSRSTHLPSDLSTPGGSEHPQSPAVHSASPMVARPAVHFPSTPQRKVTSESQMQQDARHTVAQLANSNIFIELSLDGERFRYISETWQTIIRTDPSELIGTPISDLLAPGDTNIFSEATRNLLPDDSNTVELVFRLQNDSISDEDDEDGQEPGPRYIQMEGKGMLMHGEEDGVPSHTMWVVKPSQMEHTQATPSPGAESSDGDDHATYGGALIGFHRRAVNDPVTPFRVSAGRSISTKPILCQICERQVPTWFFEKHNDTCNEVHRLEMDIGICNERLGDMKSNTRSFIKTLQAWSKSAGELPHYRDMGMNMSQPQGAGAAHIADANSPELIELEEALNQAVEILQVARDIKTPICKDDDPTDEARPMESQRLLSPTSEKYITQVSRWTRPVTKDQAVLAILKDTEEFIRSKLNTVQRMKNTIVYSERVRKEWEEKVSTTLTALDEEDADSSCSSTSRSRSGSESGSGSSSGSGSEDRSNTAKVPRGRPEGFQARLLKAKQSTIDDAMPDAIDPLDSSRPSDMQMFDLSPVNSEPIVSSYKSDEAHPPKLTDFHRTSVPVPISLHSPTSDHIHRSSPTSRLHLSTPPFPSSPKKLSLGESSHHTNLTRHSSLHAHSRSSVPLSPRISAPVPASRPTPTTKDDFEIIKPISKGAFGSVYLAKKKTTGAYYAIKVLRKSDMIVKNQITNVKAERMILMTQAESPFVVKLFFTFQTTHSLFLVMEYLNGGDCASLIKVLGCLEESWAKKYIAEVILGLEYLHKQGVVHRDLKPDNLLIDQRGHLKLTDFGLSKIGLLGRQTRTPSTISQAQVSSGFPSLRSSTSRASRSFSRTDSLEISLFGGSVSGIETPLNSESDSPSARTSLGFFNNVPVATKSIEGSESGVKTPPIDPAFESFASNLNVALRKPQLPSRNSTGAEPRRVFAGTPDYLSPETILGLGGGGDDPSVDWWAVGVVLYEFLFGEPPFHAETPDKVFENILSRHLDWRGSDAVANDEDEDQIFTSTEARNFIERLLCADPKKRLGSNGAQEVKGHPFFAGLNWETLLTHEAEFVPQCQDPESTAYFDARGAVSSSLQEEDEPVKRDSFEGSPDKELSGLAKSPSQQSNEDKDGAEDFGTFNFKNLPVLKQANDDVIKKLRSEKLLPDEAAAHSVRHSRHSSLNQRRSMSNSSRPTILSNNLEGNLSGPSISGSSSSNSPGAKTSKYNDIGIAGSVHSQQRTSSDPAMVNFRHSIGGVHRSNTLPSRKRSNSSAIETKTHRSKLQSYSTPSDDLEVPDIAPNSPQKDLVHEVAALSIHESPRLVDCLIAEDNPISRKILETILERMGCRCVGVEDGAQAIQLAMGDVAFDIIFLDYQMPVVNGDQAAKMIKSTQNTNMMTPIVAVTSYDREVAALMAEQTTLFAAVLSKPVSRSHLTEVFQRLLPGLLPATYAGALSQYLLMQSALRQGFSQVSSLDYPTCLAELLESHQDVVDAPPSPATMVKSKRKRPTPVTKSAKLSNLKSASAKITQQTISRFHTLIKRRAGASQAEAAGIDLEIEGLGGLEAYQEASATGQLKERGGDSSHVLVAWLKARNVGSVKLLEIGALRPDNYSAHSKWIKTTCIDLHSRHPEITEQDFTKRPEPSNEAGRFDIISCSLVLNFVPSPLERGEMLLHTGKFGARWLFIVLPLPCVANSRWIDRARFRVLMSSCGWVQREVKESKKLIYALYEFRPEPCNLEGQSKHRRKTLLNDAAGKNNFAIILPEVPATAAAV